MLRVRDKNVSICCCAFYVFLPSTYNLKWVDLNRQNDESTYGFETPSRQACKHLWKCCVEHHAFFRLVQVSPGSFNGSTAFSLGSRFRYSGHTEKEALRQANSVRRQPPKVGWYSMVYDFNEGRN